MPHLLAYVFPLSASQDSEGYTYKVPENLRNHIGIGDLIEIPFRLDIQEGIVADLHEAHDIPTEELVEIKEVIRVLLPTILSYAQIQTIAEQAKTLCIHVHKVAALFLPASYKRRIFLQDLNRASDTTFIPPTDLEGDFKNARLVYMENEKKTLQYARDFLEVPGSVVIAPNQRYITTILQLCSEKGVRLPYIFPADSTDTQKSKAFVEARIGDSDSFIGGRRTLFCNLSRFTRILYLEDGLFKEVYHSFHKYRIFDMLLTISRFSPHQEFVIASITPSIEVASLAIAKKIGFESFIQR